jgi:hypothetical protein
MNERTAVFLMVVNFVIFVLSLAFSMIVRGRIDGYLKTHHRSIYDSITEPYSLKDVLAGRLRILGFFREIRNRLRKELRLDSHLSSLQLSYKWSLILALCSGLLFILLGALMTSTSP